MNPGGWVGLLIGAWAGDWFAYDGFMFGPGVTLALFATLLFQK